MQHTRAAEMADGQNLLDRKHGAISIVGGRGELGTVVSSKLV